MIAIVAIGSLTYSPFFDRMMATARAFFALPVEAKLANPAYLVEIQAIAAL